MLFLNLFVRSGLRKHDDGLPQIQKKNVFFFCPGPIAGRALPEITENCPDFFLWVGSGMSPCRNSQTKNRGVVSSMRSFLLFSNHDHLFGSCSCLYLHFFVSRNWFPDRFHPAALVGHKKNSVLSVVIDTLSVCVGVRFVIVFSDGLQ